MNGSTTPTNGNVTGQEALREFVENVERIDPTDRYRPFCDSLAAIIRPHLGSGQTPTGANTMEEAQS